MELTLKQIIVIGCGFLFGSAWHSAFSAQNASKLDIPEIFWNKSFTILVERFTFIIGFIIFSYSLYLNWRITLIACIIFLFVSPMIRMIAMIIIIFPLSLFFIKH